MRIDAALISYTPNQLAEWDNRSQNVGMQTAQYCATLYAEKPDYWNKHQEEFQFKAAAYLMERAKEAFTPEEILAQFTVQRSMILIDMMQQSAMEALKKGKK